MPASLKRSDPEFGGEQGEVLGPGSGHGVGKFIDEEFYALDGPLHRLLTLPAGMGKAAHLRERQGLAVPVAELPGDGDGLAVPVLGVVEVALSLSNPAVFVVFGGELLEGLRFRLEFGGSVSVHRWSDIWLDEGFATYAEWLYSERTGGRTAKQIAAQDYASDPAGDDYWKTPPGDPGAAGVLGDAVYTRGGMALHALRTAVGDDNFFAALRAWATERAGGNGSVQDFLAVVKRVSGKNVDDVAQTQTSGID